MVRTPLMETYVSLKLLLYCAGLRSCRLAGSHFLLAWGLLYANLPENPLDKGVFAQSSSSSPSSSLRGSPGNAESYLSLSDSSVKLS